MLTDDKIFTQLKEIFRYKSNNKYNQQIIDRGFVCSKLKKGKALLVGINPSYLVGDQLNSYTYCLDVAVTDYTKHYGHFKSLIKDTKYENDWTYIDLFQIRETDQKKISDLIKYDLSFMVKQLQLTHEIINFIDPEIIIVCNSYAVNYFGINISDDRNNIWYGYNFTFNEKYGLDFIKSISKEGIINESRIIDRPILFTSTLTYMSRFDKRRLNWQIKRFAENFE